MNVKQDCDKRNGQAKIHCNQLSIPYIEMVLHIQLFLPYKWIIDLKPMDRLNFRNPLNYKNLIKYTILLNFQMGYGHFSQRGKGLHLRQYSRAFIIDDNDKRAVFVSVDGAMVAHTIKRDVRE